MGFHPSKGMRERSGRCALSLRGIREVQPHPSPDRGDGDSASSHETRPLSTSYWERWARKPAYPHISVGFAAALPQCHIAPVAWPDEATRENAPQRGPRGKS
jgi:hypothetical protein